MTNFHELQRVEPLSTILSSEEVGQSEIRSEMSRLEVNLDD